MPAYPYPHKPPLKAILLWIDRGPGVSVSKGHVPAERYGGAYPADPGPIPQGLPTRALLQLRHLQLGGGAHTHPSCTSSHTCSLIFILRKLCITIHICVYLRTSMKALSLAPRAPIPQSPLHVLASLCLLPPMPPSDPLAYLQHRRRGR
jgi:hypothetical protein